MKKYKIMLKEKNKIKYWNQKNSKKILKKSKKKRKKKID